MTDNDSFLGPPRPPTPHVWASAQDHEQRLNVGIPMAPEDEQIDTDSRMHIIGEIRLALSAEKGDVQYIIRRPRGLRFTLTNIMDAYGYMARAIVRERYWSNDPITFDQLMAMAPWLKAGHSAEVLPVDLLNCLRDGKPLVDPAHPWTSSGEHLDVVKSKYAEIIAWAQAGRDEIMFQEQRKLQS